jgi:hypothetical protein
MEATILHAYGDVRLEDVPDPTLQRPTDALVRVTAACVCGSDLWPYRRTNEVKQPTRIGIQSRCDAVVPLTDLAEVYAAMDERRAVKSLVRP